MLIRVFEMPPTFSKDFLFSGGQPASFIERDWFRDDDGPLCATEEGRRDIEAFIRRKSYFDPAKRYLVLREGGTFTIGYEAP